VVLQLVVGLVDPFLKHKVLPEIPVGLVVVVVMANLITTLDKVVQELLVKAMLAVGQTGTAEATGLVVAVEVLELLELMHLQ
jgi:hypothetical protein